MTWLSLIRMGRIAYYVVRLNWSVVHVVIESKRELGGTLWSEGSSPLNRGAGRI